MSSLTSLAWRSIHLAAFLGVAMPQTGCIFVEDDDDDAADGDISDDGDGDISDDGDGDDSPEQGCDDPRYNDGSCDLDLTCDAPDLDCFLLFDSQAEAEDFFSNFEEAVAAQEFRDPRAIIPSSDPRWQEMRTLLDQGWDAYQNVNAVGDLAERTPSLVVVQDDSINAFVISDFQGEHAAFLVVVHSSVLELNATDDEMLGLVMHELQHAVGLHIVGDVRDRIRHYYVARGTEPFGFDQDDDPVAREYGETWRNFASEVGPFSSEELGGLPFGGGQLDQILTQVLVSRSNDPNCTGAIDDFNTLTNSIGSTFSGLDSSIDVSDPRLPQDVDFVLGELRDDCLFDFPLDFIDVLAQLLGAQREDVIAQLDPNDVGLVEGEHFIDGIAALALDRRQRMRDAELDFELEADAAWTDLRYFSTEEAADDATVPVLDDASLQADGLGGFFLRILDPGTRAQCEDFLSAGDVPPYGVDLSDEHHATCWRIDHVQALADSGLVTRRIPPRRAAIRSPELRPGLPKIPSARDVVMY